MSARRHDQPYTGRALLTESALAPPVVAIGIQITIRRYRDGNARIGALLVPSVARPLSPIAHQEPVGRRSHGRTCLPFLPMAGIALPAAPEGELRVVRVRRQDDTYATAAGFA